MKINPNLVVRTLLDETIIVPTGNAIKDFNGIISTNDVASFIWQHIEDCETPEEMVKRVLEEYEIDEETAKTDVYGFLETLKTLGMIWYE